MVSLLETLYGVTAVATLLAAMAWVRTRPDNPTLVPRRRRVARVLTAVAVAGAAAAALLYIYLTPRP